MNRISALHIYLGILIPLLFSSCVTKKVSNINLANTYKDETLMLHPCYTVFHVNENESQCFFAFPRKELLYAKSIHDSVFTAYYTIHYNLRASFEGKDILDSATINSKDIVKEEDGNVSGNFSFKAQLKNSYLLEIILIDRNRNQQVREFLEIDKRQYNAPQFFEVYSGNEHLSLFKPFIKKNVTYTIRHANPTVDKIWVKYYQNDTSIAAPPYSLEQEQDTVTDKPDSLFTIGLDSLRNFSCSFSKEGLYFLQIDTHEVKGLSLCLFSDGFPSLLTTDELLEPLVYLTSDKEMKSMKELQKRGNLKAALDKFWLTCGGNPDRTKELIRKYYNRVQAANQYFSSYTEGWKTDRGMIYCIYGPPNTVYKSIQGETWIYGTESNMSSLTFYFIKADNPFTMEDYQLQRNIYFRSGWFNAVETWRNGRIYSEY
jgi:GWxTD domain-containing protein